MKRAIILILIAALAFACWSVGHSQTDGFVSTVNEKLSPAIERVKDSSVVEKAKELLHSFENKQDEEGTSEEADKWSWPSLGSIGFTKGVLNSTDDVVLVPTDDYAMGYVFEYNGEQFTAYFDGSSWRVYDSYRVSSHGDIVIICQALINEHPVYGSDWESLRTADDMAYEWEQHNLAYNLLPEDNHWRNDAKDVDLNPEDQGKSFPEIYESRTGQKLDLRNYLP
jgi:hypothetical protein